MRKPILTLLVFCFLSVSAFPKLSSEAYREILRQPQSEKLSRKMNQFYLSHPKTSEHLYESGDVVALVLESYCDRTQAIIKKYPLDPASSLAEKRVANFRNFLDKKGDLIKTGLFLFLGVYSLDAYQDSKTWKELIELQGDLGTHLLNRSKLKTNYGERMEGEARGEDLLLDLEVKLMDHVRVFCQRSTDPFFSGVVLPMIKECRTREEVLKLFAPWRDETQPIPGELLTDAEEAFDDLNQETWGRLKRELENFFDSPLTLERFIEITSQAFSIPPPKHLGEGSKK